MGCAISSKLWLPPDRETIRQEAICFSECHQPHGDKRVIQAIDTKFIEKYPADLAEEENPVFSKVQMGKFPRLPHNQLFEDPDFPADQSSLFLGNRDDQDQYTWKRPCQTTENPKMFVNGTSRRDVIQGILGDCWLLSTCAALAKRDDLLFRVISPLQPLFGANYNGQIQVNVWRFGMWETVYIDDRLPQRHGLYCYAKCLEPDEFWIAFVEKAVAKLHGSYEAIEGGMPMEAMVDLTGGLAERYELQDTSMHKTLFRYLRRSFASQAFITCSRKGDWRLAHQAEQNGLVQGHAYTVTGLFRVTLPKLGHKYLIRVRNPWGDVNEWKGPWSDDHDIWIDVPQETKEEMGFHNRCDGEFWMDFFEDFCRQFEEISICTMGPDFDLDGLVDHTIFADVMIGEWISGVTDGGCRNDLEKFAQNPQYIINIGNSPSKIRQECQDSSSNSRQLLQDDGRSHVIITLSQEHQRSQGKKLLQIGFCLYEAKLNESRLSLTDLRRQRDIGTSGSYINYREVFARFELMHGRYILIPATFEPGITSRFLLRVFSDSRFSLKILK